MARQRRRGTVARHAAHRPRSIVRDLLKIFGVTVAVVLVSALSVAGHSVYMIATSFAEEAVALPDEVRLPPPDLGAYEGEFSVLIVGTDECEPELIEAIGPRCTGPDAEGQLNDVNMLVHVSDAPRRVTVVSFPRDLMLAVPSCMRDDGSTTSAMSKQPINSVFGVGGLACVAKTVSNLSEQTIPFAAKLSFGNVVNITSAIGGVEVCIGNDGMRDAHTRIDWPPGPRTISGIDALQFLRTRHGVGDESDLARIGNQQQYLKRLLNKLVSEEVITNPATLLGLATAASENIKPSESLTNPVRMVQLALAIKDVPFDQITFAQYPVLTDPDNPNRVVPDVASAEALWTALATNQPIQLSGSAGSNGGVIEVPPSSEPTPTEPATPTPTTSGTPTTAPTEEAIILSENVHGSTADQETCSAGNR